VVSFSAVHKPAAVTPHCAIDVYLTHGEAVDKVLITTWLPMEGWTGRYKGTGGSGMTAGQFDFVLEPSIAQGFAVGSTNAGLPDSPDGNAWAGDEQLMRNFAYLSIHEMTIVGKRLAESFYGKPAKYSYFEGCSTGGRQGMMEVQRYPQNYDGVYAGAPAINWDVFLPAAAFLGTKY
jgi:feruloyl esterase